MEAVEVQRRVAEVAHGFAGNRKERQLRRHLDKADFDLLADAGFLLTGVPLELGGLWVDLKSSTRPLSEILRTLARGDPSVALVSAMHPAVLAFWLCQTDVPQAFRQSWTEQKTFIANTALSGHWWGTITSEPGSGGDVLRTRATADLAEGENFGLSGQKHFGSGSGITSYMITTAVPEGADQPDWFFMNVEGQAWDGSTGMKLISEWDGHGMIATQSHAFDFSRYPITRLAWPGNLRAVSAAASPLITSLFTAVIVGVTQAAFETARLQLARRRADLRPFEQVEWARAENEAWLIEQAYEGMLRAVETKGPLAALDTLHAKTAIAELAEALTSRMARVIGGGTFHRGSAIGWAFEDVRALGLLRPPWNLVFDTILERTWEGISPA